MSYREVVGVGGHTDRVTFADGTSASVSELRRQEAMKACSLAFGNVRQWYRYTRQELLEALAKGKVPAVVRLSPQDTKDALLRDALDALRDLAQLGTGGALGSAAQERARDVLDRAETSGFA